jgi:hypothetical protein
MAADDHLNPQQFRQIHHTPELNKEIDQANRRMFGQLGNEHYDSIATPPPKRSDTGWADRAHHDSITAHELSSYPPPPLSKY